MNADNLQAIMPFLEKPSRYLGGEINTARKSSAQIKLKFALAFPDLYEIGMSHFGLQILYHILNGYPNILVDRVFAPAPDFGARLREHRIPLTSLENRLPVREFEILGFSLLYELNYTNVLQILDLAQIPFKARDRGDDMPLVIGGGPCTCNPEPIADFFDAIVVGDGEQVVQKMVQVWFEWKAGSQPRKQDLLEAWSGITGVYIPSLPGPHFIQRAVVPNLEKALFPHRPIIPWGRPVHDRLRIEIARGCTQGCRFCQAGMIYRPVRERPVQDIIEIAREALAATGYEDLSLLSLSTGDYSQILPLLSHLMSHCQRERIAVSLPSLRAGSLNQDIMAQIKRVRKTGFTIAAEAGSQRLRDVINKKIDEAEIFGAVQSALQMQWSLIKLYFMIGLPTESDADLADIVTLVRKLRKLRGNGKAQRIKLNVSVTTFVPKAHTPFQWASQLQLAESRERIFRLKQALKLPGIQFKWQNPELSQLEGLFARGDRQLGDLLLAAYQKGCLFDGWSDRFDYHLWLDAFFASGIDPERHLHDVSQPDAPLPWDHVSSGVDRAYLLKEWQLSQSGTLTRDCRHGECQDCGVCDFISIRPQLSPADLPPPTETSGLAEDASPMTFYCLCFSKKGPARFFGHLELVNILLRAMRRAGFPLAYTQGFHPKPKLTFEDPLPVGLESLEEQLYISFTRPVSGQLILERLNTQMPEGLHFFNCTLVSPNLRTSNRAQVHYQVSLPAHPFDPERIRDFENASTLPIRLDRNGKKPLDLDLKTQVARLHIDEQGRLQMTIRRLPGKNLRPAQLLKSFFCLSDNQLQQALITKLPESACHV